jgi:hypothetical protein
MEQKLLPLFLKKLIEGSTFCTRLFTGNAVELVKKQKHYFAWIQNPHSILIRPILMLAGIDCWFNTLSQKSCFIYSTANK